jgi:hypothetical protein
MSENNQNYLTEEKFDKKFKEGLAEFAEEVLLPAVERIVDGKIAKSNHEMKSYLDDKLAETKGDIIAVIKGEKEKDKSFKTKVVEIFKRNKLGDQREIELLEALIQ